jgi:phosphoribosylaminoimidazole-succinocarboxamide synthase
LSKEIKVKKKSKLYEGKATIVYESDNEEYHILEFTDDVITPDGSKKGKIKGKGTMNNQLSGHLFNFLESYHVPTHYIQPLSENSAVIRVLEMIPVEVVMRNIATGSLVKKYGVEEGKELAHPVLEFHLKDGSKQDPLINKDHMISFEYATTDEIQQIERYTRKINAVLKSYFYRRQMLLVDFRLEFGRSKSGKIKLGNELSPDICNLWDIGENDTFDKNRFRQDLSKGEEAVQEIYNRVLGTK